MWLRAYGSLQCGRVQGFLPGGCGVRVESAGYLGQLCENLGDLGARGLGRVKGDLAGGLNAD